MKQEVIIRIMKKTVAQHIKAYLNDKSWVCSGDIDRCVSVIANRKATTISRECRRLAEIDGLEVDYRKNVAWYRISEKARKKKQVVDIVEKDGEKVAIIKYV